MQNWSGRNEEGKKCLFRLSRKILVNILMLFLLTFFFFITNAFLHSWIHKYSSVQFSSVTQSCPILCDPMDCSMPGFPVHHQLPEPTQTHVHRVGDAIQPSHALLSPSPPAFNLSQHQSLFNELVLCIRWPKYWSSSFSISFSNEYSGLISFRIDWLDLLAVQGTLKSLLQHHSSKTFSSSALSFLYSPTLTSIHDYWKNHSFD